MATVRASCEKCGDVELTTNDVHIRVCEDTNDATYSFRCPVCLMTAVKPCEIRTVDRLIASGASYETWSLPQELYEKRGVGDAVTHDDIIDLHEALADDEVFNAELDALLNP